MISDDPRTRLFRAADDLAYSMARLTASHDVSGWSAVETGHRAALQDLLRRRTPTIFIGSMDPAGDA